MRKHKSVVAILLAVMMIFTFMPTMAFADTAVDGTWSNHYSTVTVDKTDYTTAKTFGDNGVITATLSDGRYNVVPTVNPVHYIDLTGAKIYSGSTEVKSIYTTQEAFEDLFTSGKLTNAALVVNCPEDAVNYAKGKTATLGNGTQNFGWTVSVDMPENYESGSLADQTVTLTAVVETNGADGTAAKPYRDDESVISMEVTVKGATQGREAIKFFKDEVSTKASDAQGVSSDGLNPVNVTFDYDGAAHKLVNSNVDGYTVSYSVLNKSTGKYDAVGAECPSVTNVADAAKVKVTISDSYPTTDTRHKADVNYYYSLSVSPYTISNQYGDNFGAGVITFSFDADGVDGPYAYKDVEGFDPYKYVVVYAADNVVTYGRQTYTFHPTKAQKAAVAANEEELLALFAEFYDIQQTSSKQYPDVITLKFVEKTGVDATAIAKKYKVLAENFGITGSNYANKTDVVDQTATVDVSVAPVVNDKDDDISFEGQTKFVYSGKKTTKKGVLKTKKTITVKAAADSGNAITYVATKTAAGKIVVSKDGKITVKKGLKKGTYKVTVKAKTAAGNGYKAAKEKQTYTIVIKK